MGRTIRSVRSEDIDDMDEGLAITSQEWPNFAKWYKEGGVAGMMGMKPVDDLMAEKGAQSLQRVREGTHAPLKQAFEESKDSPMLGFGVGSVGKVYGKFADKLWNKIAESDAAKKMAPLGKLPAQDLYLTERYQALGEVAQVDEVAGVIGRTFRKASEADQAASYKYLVTKEATPEMIADPKVRANAVGAKTLIDNIGQKLVKRGMLPKESFEANRGSYLPRIYLRHVLNLEGQGGTGGGGGQPKPGTQGYLKARKDIPEEIRELVLGEITDPAFLSARGIVEPARDMAILDFLGKISKNDQWVLPKSFTKWNGKNVTPHWLKAEAGKIREQALHYKEGPKGRAVKLAQEMDDTANMAMRNEKMSNSTIEDVPDGYSRMPDTNRYGELRGMVVRKEIYNDVVGAANIVRGTESIAEQWLGQGGKLTKATQLWKLSKVALNPPTQVRNFVSNGVLLHLSGVSFHKIPLRLTQAIKEMRSDGAYYKIAKKYGVSKTSFAENELYHFERELKSMTEKGNPLSSIKSAASTVGEKAGNLYQLSETVFKTAKIIDGMKKGLSEEQAALAAQKALFDYSLIPPSVRYLRNAPMGVPFITFQYKALPRVLEAAIKTPWKFLPYTLIPVGMSAMIEDEYDVTSKDVEALRKALPDFIQEKDSAYILPYKDKNGRWVAMDIGYFFPWQMATETLKKAKNLDLHGLTSETGLLGSPTWQTGAAVLTNIDPFTKREITNKADPPSKQAADIMRFAWRMAAPTWLTDIGAAQKLYDAVTDTPDRQGDPGNTVPQALGRFVGVNTYPVEPQKQRRKNIRHRVFEIRGIERRMKSLLRDKRNEDKKGIREQYGSMIREKRADLRKYMKESKVHPKLR